MFHLADGDEILEARLWQCVARIAEDWQRVHGEQPLLRGLLNGETLPSKNNLRTRLFQRADRDADYTDLPNPIRRRGAARVAA
jgi:siderophore synthetase component